MTSDTKGVWTLGDLFRGGTFAGWNPQSIEFERRLGVLRAAGSAWSTTLFVRAGGRGADFEVGTRPFCELFLGEAPCGSLLLKEVRQRIPKPSLQHHLLGAGARRGGPVFRPWGQLRR